MKNNFFYTFLILISITNFSNTLLAQSTNEKQQALNAYLESIIKDTTQVIFIAKEKITSNETLHIFQLNSIMVIDSDGNGKGDATLYKKKDFEKMKKEYKNNCAPGKRIWCNGKYWNNEDFIYKKVVLENMNTDKQIELIHEKHNNWNIKVYGFSEPIYYQNKKYVVFTRNIYGFNSFDTDIFVMKKIKNKWVVTHKGENPNVFN